MEVRSSTDGTEPASAPRQISDEPYENLSQLNDDETPDDTTVASMSYVGEENGYERHMPAHKRKHDEIEYDDYSNLTTHDLHCIYADELLDYFVFSRKDPTAQRPDPPINYQPDSTVDTQGHAALHWACAMGDIEVLKQLQRFGANTAVRNQRDETPLMRTVVFTNCHDKQTMPIVVNALIETIECVDQVGGTAFHHCGIMTASNVKHRHARYYLDVILNKLQETWEPEAIQQLLDQQDIYGDTACHIAARNGARKCVRALIGRGASTNIPNAKGITAEDLIQELNNTRSVRAPPPGSSSPFAPEMEYRPDPMYRNSVQVREPVPIPPMPLEASHHSVAAMSVETKVIPAVLQKFSGLTQAFDAELTDKAESFKEARRILDVTRAEAAALREQAADLKPNGDPDPHRLAAQAELNELQQDLLAVLERQQRLQLARLVYEEQLRIQADDGLTSVSFDHVSEYQNRRASMQTTMREMQAERAELMQERVDAIALAGMGEKGAQYRNLIMSCLGVPEEEVDVNMEDLVNMLEEEQDTELAAGRVVE